MAKKSVNDPGSLGWTDDGNGFWSWSAGGSNGGGSAESAVLQDREEDQQVVSNFTFTANPTGDGLFTNAPNKFVVDADEKRASFLAGSDNISMGDSYVPWDVDIQGSLNMMSLGFPYSNTQYTAYGLSNDAGSITLSHEGNVGIGMYPATFDLSAKEQLKEWKTKAKKASWPVVTDGAFEQEPTEDLVAQWIETRASGDRLQVDGNISATGNVNAAELFLKGATGTRTVWEKTGNYGWSAGVDNTSYFYINGGGVADDAMRIQPNNNSVTFSGHVQSSAEFVAAKDDNNAYLSTKIGGVEGAAGVYIKRKASKDQAFFTCVNEGVATFYINGSSDLTSRGSATFSNTKIANRTIWSDTGGSSGIHFGAKALLPALNGVASTAGDIDFGGGDFQWKNGYFSGTVSANKFSGDGSSLTNLSVDPLRTTTGGIGIGKGNSISTEYQTDSVIEMGTATMHGGNPEHTGVRISCAMPSSWGTQEVLFNLATTWRTYNETPALKITNAGVTATKFFGDGSALTGISGGLPPGDFTHNGVITATDFIAKSDERLKTRIAPMPVGLIDDIKPVSWDWIDGGGKSAGVVAQQLQEIGLGDYVHENEDGELGVNYQALTAILLAEVIALKKSIK